MEVPLPPLLQMISDMQQRAPDNGSSNLAAQPRRAARYAQAVASAGHSWMLASCHQALQAAIKLAATKPCKRPSHQLPSISAHLLLVQLPLGQLLLLLLLARLLLAHILLNLQEAGKGRCQRDWLILAEGSHTRASMLPAHLLLKQILHSHTARWHAGDMQLLHEAGCFLAATLLGTPLLQTEAIPCAHKCNQVSTHVQYAVLVGAFNEGHNALTVRQDALPAVLLQTTACVGMLESASPSLATAGRHALGKLSFAGRQSAPTFCPLSALSSCSRGRPSLRTCTIRQFQSITHCPTFL